MNIYTQADWTRDKTFKAEPMQEITEELFDYWLGVLPPICWHDGQFLCSEPYDHQGENYSGRYHAFFEHDSKFFYAGLKTRKQANETLFRQQ